MAGPPRPLRKDDAPGVAKIFNDYVAHSFAAYPEHVLSLEEIKEWLAPGVCLSALGVDGPTKELIGFALLRRYSPYSSFSQTALVTYFVAPDYTRQGIGTSLLRALESEALQHGVRILMAHVSSRNSLSLAFHRTHGFAECGMFRGIGTKQGKPFDVVWFEKALTAPA
jgi:phosphinothricin acetyltransferase